MKTTIQTALNQAENNIQCVICARTTETMNDHDYSKLGECENISCNRPASETVVYGENKPFRHNYCEIHAQREIGKHNDARREAAQVDSDE